MVRFPWILRTQGVDEPVPGAPPAGDEEARIEKDAAPTTVVSGVVATVNLMRETCTLMDGTVIRISGHVAEAMAALRGAAVVRLDAEGILTDEGLIAVEVWVRAE